MAEYRLRKYVLEPDRLIVYADPLRRGRIGFVVYERSTERRYRTKAEAQGGEAPFTPRPNGTAFSYSG
jgi:hypothetical protein